MFDGIFKALADPNRQKILELLEQEGRMSAGSIAAHFEMSNGTVSYHLKLLKQAGLIRSCNEGTTIYYSLNTSVFEDMIRWFSRFQDHE